MTAALLLIGVGVFTLGVALIRKGWLLPLAPAILLCLVAAINLTRRLN